MDSQMVFPAPLASTLEWPYYNKSDQVNDFPKTSNHLTQHCACTAKVFSYFSQPTFTFQTHTSKSFYWLLSVYTALPISVSPGKHLLCPLELSSGITDQEAIPGSTQEPTLGWGVPSVKNTDSTWHSTVNVCLPHLLPTVYGPHWGLIHLVAPALSTRKSSTQFLKNIRCFSFPPLRNVTKVIQLKSGGIGC